MRILFSICAGCLFCFSSPLIARGEACQENYLQLDRFWRILFQQYHFGYTLFGSKPLSFHRYDLSIGVGEPPHCKKDPQLHLLWRMWEKGHSSNTGANFIFNRVIFFYEGKKYEEFYLLNRAECLATINKYWKDFQNCFSDLESPLSLLNTICQDGPHIIPNHRLLGLLLGYGDHNSSLFQEREVMFNMLASHIYHIDNKQLAHLTKWELMQMRLARKQPILIESDRWDTVFSRYRALNRQLANSLSSLVPHALLCALPLPCYVVDASHPETFDSLRSYLLTQRKLNRLFYRPNFLKIILSQFKPTSIISINKENSLFLLSSKRVT